MCYYLYMFYAKLLALALNNVRWIYCSNYHTLQVNQVANQVHTEMHTVPLYF